MEFRGWSGAALEFFEGLEADNSKAYWQAHRDTYEREVAAPMHALLADLAGEFGAGRMFRPYSDMRFGRGRPPYKTTSAASFDGGGYVQFSADGLLAGSGSYYMEPDQLRRYRAAVDADESGRDLELVVAHLSAEGLEVRAHDSLATAPRGYPRDHPRIELLRLKGLAAVRQWPPARWMATRDAETRIVEALRTATPLQAWLDDYVGAPTAD